MKTLVCPTCGCSLVRLGISKDAAVAHSHECKEYFFCCDGCLEQFIADPEKHLHETGGLMVCPVCLTEKSPELTKKLERDGAVLYFCRCPLCMEAFKKNPEYYIRRLEGKEDYSGTFLVASSPE